ncbi:MAG TPA: PAS domain S-box protein [Burkholderiales bacterium]|nr:PAS domain S-box protein [Burkholderiales bacterium]
MQISRLATINYGIRSASFAWCFAVVGLILWERHAPLLAWAVAALLFLAYPHAAYAVTIETRNQRAAELRNLRFDSILLGAWVAALAFPTWPAFAALFATTLNNAVVGGWLGIAISTACFAGGAFAWIVLRGYQHWPMTGELVTALCFFGSIVYACGIGVVTAGQRRRLRAAHEALREGERRYRLIAEHAGDLVAMVDRNGRWLYNSPSYARLLAPSDLEHGADAFRGVHEDDQFRVRGAVQVVVRSGEPARLRFRLHTKDGTVRRFEALVHAVKDEAGGITGAVIAARDVTELRDREEQLEVAYAAFERMAEAMMITNAAGRILSVNLSYSRITGYGAADVIGHNEREFRTAMQPQAFYDDVYAELLRSGHWTGITWCRRRDGTLYREWRSVSAVRDVEGRVTHFVSLFRELNGHDAGAGTLPGAARSA